ncbi:kinetochore protein NDC80 homolog [Euphorbia lathyris]|uniref:kinetochore protein NDC80 homolog n=1 Tax=Euphorbia lathyris TaxID=212925 RepID=UPI0033134EAC
MRPSTRRRPADSFNPQPTPDRRQFSFSTAGANTSRDSDASFASSRPSTVGVGRSSELYTDRAHQASLVRSINDYLSTRSSPVTLRTHPISSAKEITKVIEFLLEKLDFPSTKIEDDLFIILKSLNCHAKLNKSTLRAPNTPHNWPSFLAIIEWLVQIAKYKEHLAADSRSFLEKNSMLVYAFESYLNYIRGDDDSVDALDREFMVKLEKERDSVLESVKLLEANFNELGAKAEALKAGPTQREKLEYQRSLLEEDLRKFHAIIAHHNQGIEAVEKVLEEKRKQLETKVEEKKRIDQENDDLKKRVDEQSFNARDADRMKRELQAVERDIEEAETARNAWEEKTWNLDADIGIKFKELEALAMECNQAVRRLKLGNGFQYVLNPKGATPADIMGIDYKSIVKPGLQSFADEIKRSSMEKLEEFISLQKESSELTAKIEHKRNQTAAVQSHTDEMEAHIDHLRKETEEYTNRYLMEAKKLADDVEMECHNLDILEKEAAEILKSSKEKLQETIEQTEEEIQMHGQQLFAVVDAVSKYKEHMESKISEVKSKLARTVDDISALYKDSCPCPCPITM